MPCVRLPLGGIFGAGAPSAPSVEDGRISLSAKNGPASHMPIPRDGRLLLFRPDIAPCRRWRKPVAPGPIQHQEAASKPGLEEEIWLLLLELRNTVQKEDKVKVVHVMRRKGAVVHIHGTIWCLGLESRAANRITDYMVPWTPHICWCGLPSIPFHLSNRKIRCLAGRECDGWRGGGGKRGTWLHREFFFARDGHFQVKALIAA